MEVSDYTFDQRVAIIILSVGPDRASTIFQAMSPTEIDKITLAISQLGVVHP